MDFSWVAAFATVLLSTFAIEFVKSLGSNAGTRVSNTIPRPAKPRKKKKSLLKRILGIVIYTIIVWAVINFWSLIIALI